MGLIGREYRSFDGWRRWELPFERVRVVMLDTGVERGCDHDLVGFGAADLLARWVVGGILGTPGQYDGVVSVWVADGWLWAGTWSGFSLRVDHRSGQVVERVFTK